MATARSNLDSVAHWLRRMVEGFNFESPGIEGKGLANELLNVVADEITERTGNRQLDIDGGPLKPNAPAYAASTKKRGRPVGVLTGEMLSQREMHGTREILQYSARMSYGVTDFARKKAEWFTRGSEENGPEDIEYSGAQNQPPRPFYGMDDQIRDAVLARAAEALQHYVEESSGA